MTIIEMVLIALSGAVLGYAIRDAIKRGTGR
jgi:hypothetical protein